MNILNYLFIIIIFILTLLLFSYHKKLNYISTVLDEVLKGNLNQRIRFQNYIRPVRKLTIKINSLIDRFQEIVKKNNISEESRKKMISNVSHDLRTPLTSILGYMELILNDNTLNEDKKNQYLKIVYDKGFYLYNMLEEFFQVSKLDSNDTKLEIKKINISEIIRQNIVSFFYEFKKLNIQPKINMMPHDIYALYDEKALNRILSNLINNALKYGTQRALIGIDLIENTKNISITIWDNGAGIPKEDLDFVFDRLYTAEKSRKLNLKSSGLGLTIVKKLVESLGGTISVSSIPFEKTAFTFTLPKI